MNTENLTGIVLCGGKSKRMGFDKGLVPYKNKALVSHAIHSIEVYCSEILLSANIDTYNSFGYKTIEDHYKNIGPLGGIHAALSASQTSQNLITACDIPFIDKETLEKIKIEASRVQHVLLKLRTGFFQPFPVVLSKNILPLIEFQVKKKNFKLQELYTLIEQQMGKDVSIFVIENAPKNINTRDDLLP